MRYYIVTGASRGIGEGIARALLTEGSTVFSISRQNNPVFEKLAVQTGGRYIYIECDLSQTAMLDGLMEEVFSSIDFDEAEGLYLINNAGVLLPIGPAEGNSAEETEQHIRVNLLAPMRLTSGFIAGSGDFTGRKVVVNISSGAARHPYFGWSCYCAGKAGLEMFSKVVGVEQRETVSPVVIYSVDPGIVDTEMQAQIRASSDEQFKDKSKFIQYLEMGYLTDILETGSKIAETLDDPTIATGDTVSVRIK